ncbi:MAG: POTRA domain-containing protein, partial [Limnobacter sp.]|nr:POTRA domain-containing protein [Limnobacter sp.]
MKFKVMNNVAQATFVFSALLVGVANAQPLVNEQGQGQASSPSAFHEPRFELAGFELEGARLIPYEQLYPVLQPFLNRPIGFSDLRNATAALEREHALAGYEVVRVLIPEQDLQPKGGVLRLLIVDARLNEVLIEGAKQFDSAWLVAQMPSLRQGEVINTREMDADIRLLATNPSLYARVSLEPGFEPRQVDALVKVAEQPVHSTFLTLDNTGSAATGDFRAGVVYQHNNVKGLGHQFTGQVVTSPGHWSDVKVFNLGYKVPLPHWQSLFEVSYTDSSVDAGTLAV